MAKIAARETVYESLLLFDLFPTCHRKILSPWPRMEGRGSDHPVSGWQRTDLAVSLEVLIYTANISSRGQYKRVSKTNLKHSPREATV